MRPIDEAAWALRQQRLLVTEQLEPLDSVSGIIESGLRVEGALSLLLAEWSTPDSSQDHQADRRALALDLQLDGHLARVEELLDAVDAELSDARESADQVNGVEAAAHRVLSDNATRLRAF